MSSRRLSDALSDAPQFAQLTERLSRNRQAAAAITQLCAELVPDFDPKLPGSCQMSGQVLRLTASSAASIAKLRQVLPRLQRVLREQLCEGIEIDLKVQPGRMRYPKDALINDGYASTVESTTSRPPSSTASSEALKLAEKLLLTSQCPSIRQAALSLRDALRSRSG